MERNYIDACGVKLSYLESNREKSPILFFLHGNSSSATFWDLQLNAPQLEPFRIIAFDMPAHGESDGMGPEAESYTMPGIARVISTAIETLARSQSYMVCGCSLGTNYLAETLKYNLHPIGIALIGPTILGVNYTLDKVFLGNTAMDCLFSDEPVIEDYRLYLFDAIITRDAYTEETLLQNYANVKAPFRSSIMPNFLKGEANDQIDLLTESGIPILLIFGQTRNM